MGLFQTIIEKIKELATISEYVDTNAADLSIRNNIHFRGPNVWILTFSIVIASVGLNVNSIPVIIGAMLISPLMGPIFGIGLGLGISDTGLMKDSFKNLLVMMAVSLVASTLYFAITPLRLTNPTELLARTTPTIFDVIIALFGGLAGTVEMARKEKGTVFSGVAIATALMPPLCTAGFGLASGNFTYFAGAIYLFFINCIFIIMATYVMVKYLKFENKSFEDIKVAKKTKSFITIFLILFIVPSVITAVVMVKENNFNQEAMAFVEDNKVIDKAYIFDYKLSHHKGSVLEIFLAGDVISDEDRKELIEEAAKYGIKENQLVINEKSTQTDEIDEMAVLREIYEFNSGEISKKDERIEELETQLQNLQQNSVPYVQISKEINMVYPQIKEVFISYGTNVDVTNVDSLMTGYVVLLRTDSLLTDSARVADWFKLRLGSENVKLLY